MNHIAGASRGESGSGTLLICLLISLAALPDAMIPLALKASVMDRWGVSPSAAHWFIAASLVGSFLALPALWRLQQRWAPATLISVAALVNAVALVLLWSPVSYPVALCIRLVEGGADLVSLGVLLGLLEAGSRHRAGHRFGPAGVALMFGLACGAILGGQSSELLGGSVFLLGAAFCVLLALAAHGTAGQLAAMSQRQLRLREAASRAGRRSPLWPALVFAFGDRGLGAILSVTAVIYLVDEVGLTAGVVGAAMGASLFVLGLGSWPAGILADRVGPLPVRVLSVIGYSGAFAALAAAPWINMGAVVLVLVVLGAAGAGLYPTSLVVASRARGGAAGMGGVHTSGSVGYLV
ncbi:MAG: MFS transporter, partial [Phycisphaerales bacterium]|nr:MFS transporter [Phycisphaerales bacterium]